MRGESPAGIYSDTVRSDLHTDRGMTHGNRFCTLDEVVAISQHPFCRGSAFADNAKQLLIPLLGMPSNNVVAALLFLAYYELGMNNEAGEREPVLSSQSESSRDLTLLNGRPG